MRRLGRAMRRLAITTHLSVPERFLIRFTRAGTQLAGLGETSAMDMVAQIKTTPPLRLLRAFCLAARHSSFKDAADRLALTPSAVSHQVKELEEQLGVTLFERRTRSVVLTAVGRQLLEDLEPALAALGAAIERTRSGSGARRQLTVVMPPFFASEMFAPQLPAFHARHPGIDIQVDTHDPRPGQHSGFSDVSIVLAAQAPSDPGIEAVRLMPLRLVAAASRKVADSMAGKQGAHAFDGQTLISHRNFRNDVWDLWVNQLGLDLRQVRNVVEFDSMVAVARAAERDGGVALVPALVCKPWFERGALVHLEGFDLRGTDAYYLVSRHDDAERPEVLALVQWAIEQFKVAD
jgi:LysR family glycine cleavage system transcriptional activator